MNEAGVVSKALGRFDVIVVPFPFTDKAASRRRPALVLSNSEWNAASGHVICAMITSARQSAWPLDVSITDLASAGLNTGCVVRMKLITLDSGTVLRSPGTLGTSDAVAVASAMDQSFGQCH